MMDKRDILLTNVAQTSRELTIAVEELTAERNKHVREAVAAGVPIRQVALASGLSRQTIYKITQ